MTPYPRRSPLKAIRAFCVECQGDSPQAVTDCHDLTCPFHAYSHGTPPEGARHQPMKAIRRYCFDHCQAGAGRDEVLSCQGDKAALGPCPVYPFRLGVNPNKSKPLSAERRAALIEAGKKNRFLPGANRPFNAPESTKTGRAIL